MISLASQVDQFGDLRHCYDKSASTVCCAVCGDLSPSVLSYHKHNVNKHTCHELSLAIIKLFCLQLGQKCILNEKTTDSSFECDSLYYKNNHELKKEANLEVQKNISREEICQETEVEDNSITNILQNLEGKLGNEASNKIYLGSFKDNEEPAAKDAQYTNSGFGQSAKDGQYTNKEGASETGKYNINKKENSRLRIKKRKSISKSTNEGNNLYEYNKVVPSKEIKLEEDMLRGNKGLNSCDYLVAEEVFLQPHDYTEEAVSVEAVTEEAAVTVVSQSEGSVSVMSQSEADDSLHSLIQDENYIHVNSNNTFSEYDHPQMMHQSENESENDYEFIPISGSEMEGNYDINLLAHSPRSEVFSTTDSISLASLIFLILQNSVEGLPVSVIDTLLQGLFPYFFKNLSYSYAKCDMLDLIKKTLRKERGFRKTRVKGMAYNDPVWEITSSISKYEEEIQNSSNLDDFTQSPALLKALKRRQVKIDNNGHGLPTISYSPHQQRSFSPHQQRSFQEGALKSRQVKIDNNGHGLPTISYSPHQQHSFQEGNRGENISFKQGYNDNSDRNMARLPNQDSFNIDSHSRSDKPENMVMNNNNSQCRYKDYTGVYDQDQELENMVMNNNNSELLTDLNHIKPDLKGMMQNKLAKIAAENAQTADVSKPKRKKFKNEKLSQSDSLAKETCVLDLENSNEWGEIENIHVKTEPLLWGQEWDQGGQEWDNCNQNISYEDVEINNYIYSDEKIYDIDTEALNISSESNQSTFENETNFVLDNIKEIDGSEKRLTPQKLYEHNCSSESLQQSIQQRIPWNVLYEKNNVSIEEKTSREEPSQCHYKGYTGVYDQDQDQEPTQQSKRQRIPGKEKDMNKLKMSLDDETENRNQTKKKQRKRKQSSAKSDGLIRNLTTHRISEKMRRKELNEQFDYLMKRVPEYGLGKSLPKIAILKKSRKYVSKLKNANIKLLIEKESLEEYQQTLINSLKKRK